MLPSFKQQLRNKPFHLKKIINIKKQIGKLLKH